MAGRRFLLVENRHPDRLNVLVFFVVGRNVNKRVDIFPRPFEKNHAARHIFNAVFQLADEIRFVSGIDEALHFTRVRFREILQAINPLVDVRQGQDIQNDIDR